MTNGYTADFMTKRLEDNDLPLVEAPKTQLPRARYRFGDGSTVTIHGISPMLILGAQSEAGKPEPPVRAVKMAGGGVQHVPRRDDEPVLTPEEIEALANPGRRQAEEEYARYRADLATWHAERSARMARLVFLIGVEDSPPPEVAALWKQLGFGGEMDIKFAWLASKLPDDQAMQHFFDTVTSLTIATEEGLERAEAMFQSGVSGGAGSAVGAAEQAQRTPGAAQPEETQARAASAGDSAEPAAG